MYKYLGLLMCFFSITVSAQTTDITQPKKKRKHEIYLSWGYNAEWYTKSNVKVSQPGLNNDYTLEHVTAHDHKGWDKTLFSSQLTIPQYNYRIGYILNKEKGLAIELNFDHTKYIVEDPQVIKIKGKVNNQDINDTIHFTAQNGFYYFLNNGANFFLINLVKSWNLYESKSEKLKIDALGKIGIGPVVPHVENSFFGKENKPHFQFGGWNTGIEGAIKVSMFKYAYFEYSSKLDYARYSNLKIYEGTAKQAFGTFEMILSFGINIPAGKKQ